MLQQVQSAEFSGHVELTNQWAYCLLKKMNLVLRKATTGVRLRNVFLEDVATTVSMEEIPADLILNWDQTGIKIDGHLCQ